MLNIPHEYTRAFRRTVVPSAVRKAQLRRQRARRMRYDYSLVEAEALKLLTCNKGRVDPDTALKLYDDARKARNARKRARKARAS